MHFVGIPLLTALWKRISEKIIINSETKRNEIKIYQTISFLKARKCVNWICQFSDELKMIILYIFKYNNIQLIVFI